MTFGAATAVTILVVLGAGCGGGNGGGGIPSAPDAASDVEIGVGDGADAAADDTVASDAAASSDGLPPGLRIVMVTNGAATPTPGDAIMTDRLRGRGFDVTFISDVAVTAADVAGQDLVVISSSAESGPLGTKLRDIALPILCVENGAFPTMGLTGTTLATDYGSTFNQTAIVIAVDAPWSIGTLTGSVTITSTPAELGWAVPAASAVIEATMADNPAHAALFAYPTGSQMVGIAAPARRVGFAIRETLAAHLTADGLTLFDAAVTFALGAAP